MSAPTWTLVSDAVGEHRIFRRADGALAVTGRSGRDPDESEDGPLLLVTGGRAWIEIVRDRARLTYEVMQVLVGQCCRISTGPHVLPYLKQYKYKVARNAELLQALRAAAASRLAFVGSRTGSAHSAGAALA